MATEYWRDQIEHVILCTGDMIVDGITGNYGLLVERVKKMLVMMVSLIFTSGK